MKRTSLTILLLILLITSWVVVAQDDEPADEQQDATNACADLQGEAGLHTVSLMIEAATEEDTDETQATTEREYVVYVPDGYMADVPTPVVLTLHGFSASPDQQREITEWEAVADDEGFIVVYPVAVGIPSRWAYRFMEGTRDVDYLDAILDDLAQSYCVDETRIYASGFSAGGAMAYRYACERPERVAALGTMAASFEILPDACMPERPVPTIAFHGTADPIVPYEGGRAGPFILPAFADWVAAAVERNGCTDMTEIEPMGDVTGVEYTGCDAPVLALTIADGGHVWAGGAAASDVPAAVAGYITQDIDGSQMMWDFFSQFSHESHP